MDMTTIRISRTRRCGLTTEGDDGTDRNSDRDPAPELAV